MSLLLPRVPTRRLGASTCVPSRLTCDPPPAGRHGDIEDALLALTALKAIGDGKTFNKLTVSRVYFGNWLRDYSQAIDVGTVKAVSAEAIRLLLCVLGFLTFGYGSGEFEVTSDRLGCYRPEDHIDNPKNYADNVDARQYDRRLRGPVDERVELGIDQNSGMKNYIANERAGIMTSAQHVRNLFGRCIELGRNYRRTGSKPDRYEALRLLGTGLHCLEGRTANTPRRACTSPVAAVLTACVR